jgi:hypothetical protein
MFIVAQMNADGGEAVRSVVARIRNGIVAISDATTFATHRALSAWGRKRRYLAAENEIMSTDELQKALRRYLENLASPSGA